MDARAGKLHLEGTREPVPGVRGEDEAVEFLSDVKRLRL
jgi:hypothetical protein